MVIANIEFDLDGNAFLIFPEDMIVKLGWKEGDEINVVPSKDGLVLTKAARGRKK